MSQVQIWIQMVGYTELHSHQTIKIRRKK